MLAASHRTIDRVLACVPRCRVENVVKIGSGVELGPKWVPSAPRPIIGQAELCLPGLPRILSLPSFTIANTYQTATPTSQPRDKRDAAQRLKSERFFHFDAKTSTSTSISNFTSHSRSQPFDCLRLPSVRRGCPGVPPLIFAPSSFCNVGPTLASLATPWGGHWRRLGVGSSHSAKTTTKSWASLILLPYLEIKPSGQATGWLGTCQSRLDFCLAWRRRPSWLSGFRTG